jgi:HEPN domain-containing protein
MNETYLEEWIRKAEEDYVVAITLARKRKDVAPSATCFHCQQCVEKYLKAFLIQHRTDVPRTHDLLELHKLCTPIDPGLSMIGDLLDILNPYSVEFRYPGEVATIEEAKTAVITMKKVRRFVRNLLGVDIE